MITKHRPLFKHPNRKLRKPKQHPERDLQCECVYWFRKNHKNEIIFFVPNELAYNRAAEMKKLGLLRGVSDLVVLLKDGRALFCELKSVDGAQSREQRIFQQKVERLGYAYVVIRTLKEFKDVIENKEQIV